LVRLNRNTISSDIPMLDQNRIVTTRRSVAVERRKEARNEKWTKMKGGRNRQGLRRWESVVDGSARLVKAWKRIGKSIKMES